MPAKTNKESVVKKTTPTRKAKPRAKPVQKSLDLQSSPKKTDKKESKVVLRIPTENLLEVDSLIKKREIKTPRNMWLLEAILEKVKKEKKAGL